MTENNQEDEDIEIPKWDVALASLVRDEYKKNNKALNIEDFQRLSREYSIRFDDIMATLFELVIHGKWDYKKGQHIDRELINKLYVNGRLHDKDLREFTGDWTPLNSSDNSS